MSERRAFTRSAEAFLEEVGKTPEDFLKAHVQFTFDWMTTKEGRRIAGDDYETAIHLAAATLHVLGDNERLTDMHRKAVAGAVILLEEKTDRDEEIERLRSELADVYGSEHLLAAENERLREALENIPDIHPQDGYIVITCPVLEPSPRARPAPVMKTTGEEIEVENAVHEEDWLA